MRIMQFHADMRICVAVFCMCAHIFHILIYAVNADMRMPFPNNKNPDKRTPRQTPTWLNSLPEKIPGDCNNVSSSVDHDVLSQVSPTSPQRPPVSHGRSTSSPVSLEATLAAASISNSDNSGAGGGRKSPRYETPPGTPPPPYVTEPELVTWGGLTGGSTSRPIITMEDTDTEDEEGQQAKE